MDAADSSTSPKLIVNVAQNGGGYITLGYRMLYVLHPFVEPLWGNYNIKKNDINEFFTTSTDAGNTFSTQERFNLSTSVIFQNNEWYFDSTTT